MHFVWEWHWTLGCSILLCGLGLSLGLLYLCSWMNAHDIWTLSDLFTYSRMKRYKLALARGGFPCIYCNIGREYYEHRYKDGKADGVGRLIYIGTRPCSHCCGVGAILPEPKPQSTFR